jgi:hypothetical protein
MSFQHLVKQLKTDSKAKVPSTILSPITYKNVIFGITWGSRWGGVPYEFDMVKKRVIITKQGIRWCTIITTVQAINCAFYIIRMLSAVLELKQNVSLFGIAFGFLTTTWSLGILILTLQVGFFKRNEFLFFINSNLEYCEYLKGMFYKSIVKV